MSSTWYSGPNFRNTVSCLAIDLKRVGPGPNAGTRGLSQCRHHIINVYDSNNNYGNNYDGLNDNYGGSNNKCCHDINGPDFLHHGLMLIAYSSIDANKLEYKVDQTE